MAVQEFGVLGWHIDNPRYCHPVDSRKDLATATAVKRNHINQEWMDKGVTVFSPETTWIEPEVEIGKDAVIHQNVVLMGRSKIGNDVIMGPGSVVKDAEIGNRQQIAANSFIESEKGD